MRRERLAELEERMIEMIMEEITYGVEVRPETDLLLTGLVDSISIIRIVTWIEEFLDIIIDPVDIVLDDFQTVALMVAYANRR